MWLGGRAAKAPALHGHNDGLWTRPSPRSGSVRCGATTWARIRLLGSPGARRAELEEAEALVNAHVDAWKAGLVRPIGAALDAMLVRWRDLAVGDELHVTWTVHERRGRRTNSCSGRAIARMEPRR